MEWESMLALGLLCAALTSFLMEKVSVDVTAFLDRTNLRHIRTKSQRQMAQYQGGLRSFFKSGPITIAAMFVIKRIAEPLPSNRAGHQSIG